MDPSGDRDPRPLLPVTGSERSAFWALVTVALLVRLAAWLERIERGTFDGMLDTRIYRQIATQLGADGWAPAQAFFMSPLYPYLMAATGAGDGGPAVGLMLVQTSVALLALVVLAIATRAHTGEGPALGVLALGALAGPLVVYDTSLLPDGLATSCTAITIGLVLLRHRLGSRALVGAGIATAVGFLLRANLLLLALAIAVGLVVGDRRDRSVMRRSLLAYATPVLVAMAMLSAMNFAAEGLLAPRSYNGGLNLYIGNNPSAEGTYTTINQIHPGDPMGRAAAEQARGRSLDSSEVDAFWREQAMQFVADSPGEALRLVGRKALLFLHPMEMPQMEDLALLRHESRSLAVARVGWGALAALAIIGWMRGPSGLRRRFWPLWAALGSALVVGLVFFVNGRLRMAAWPALLPLAGLGLGVVWRASRERRLRVLLLPLVVVLSLRIVTSFVDVHAVYVHARSAARYAALEALEGNRVYAQQWLRVMEEYRERPNWFGGGRAIDATLRDRPDADLMLRTERAAALFALGDLRGAFEELVRVTQERPGFLRAQRGLLDVADRLLQSGVDDPRVREARARAAQALRGGGR